MSSSLALLRRTTVAVCLAIGALLGFVGLLISPALPDDPAAAAGLLASPAGTAGIQLFVFSQLFFAIGLVGLAHLTVRRSPILGVAGAVLAGLGVFGHTVYGGVMLTQVALAGTDPQAMAAAFSVAQGGLFTPFMLLGLAGNVVGIILIATAVIRSRVAALWMPIALLVWVAVEFVLSNFVEWAPYLSLVIGAIAFAGLTVAVWRSDPAAWRTAAEASVSTDVAVPAAA